MHKDRYSSDHLEELEFAKADKKLILNPLQMSSWGVEPVLLKKIQIYE